MTASTGTALEQERRERTTPGEREDRLMLSVEQEDGSWQVRLRGNTLSFVHRRGKTLLEERQVSPSGRAWQRFWRSVERIGVWQWADGYEGEQAGQRWQLALGHGRRQLRTGGSAFPPLVDPLPTPEFLRLCGAIARLVGEVALRPPDRA